MLPVSKVSLPADKHQFLFFFFNFTNNKLLWSLKAILISSVFSNFSLIDISTGEGST